MGQDFSHIEKIYHPHDVTKTKHYEEERLIVCKCEDYKHRISFINDLYKLFSFELDCEAWRIMKIDIDLSQIFIKHMPADLYCDRCLEYLEEVGKLVVVFPEDGIIIPALKILRSDVDFPKHIPQCIRVMISEMRVIHSKILKTNKPEINHEYIFDDNIGHKLHFSCKLPSNKNFNEFSQKIDFTIVIDVFKQILNKFSFLVHSDFLFYSCGSSDTRMGIISKEIMNDTVRHRNVAVKYCAVLHYILGNLTPYLNTVFFPALIRKLIDEGITIKKPVFTNNIDMDELLDGIILSYHGIKQTNITNFKEDHIVDQKINFTLEELYEMACYYLHPETSLGFILNKIREKTLAEDGYMSLEYIRDLRKEYLEKDFINPFDEKDMVNNLVFMAHDLNPDKIKFSVVPLETIKCYNDIVLPNVELETNPISAIYKMSWENFIHSLFKLDTVNLKLQIKTTGIHEMKVGVMCQPNSEVLQFFCGDLYILKGRYELSKIIDPNNSLYDVNLIYNYMDKEYMLILDGAKCNNIWHSGGIKSKMIKDNTNPVIKDALVNSNNPIMSCEEQACGILVKSDVHKLPMSFILTIGPTTVQIKIINDKPFPGEFDLYNNVIFENCQMKINVKQKETGTTPDYEPDDFECLICCDDERSFACIPCGHLTMCAGCEKKMYTCPVCRAVIEKTIKIFF